MATPHFAWTLSRLASIQLTSAAAMAARTMLAAVTTLLAANRALSECLPPIAAAAASLPSAPAAASASQASLTLCTALTRHMSAAAAAAAPTDQQPSTSAASSGRAKSHSTAAASQESAAPQASSSGAAASAGPVAGAAAQQSGSGSYDEMALYRRSRYTQAYRQILYREMMLKTSPRQWTSVPSLKSITLTISAAADTRENRSPVPFQDMLLYQLALEMVSGQPAHFLEPKGQQRVGKAEAVQVKLTGEPMMNFLEKLVYMVLPNQIGFEGATHPQAEDDAPLHPSRVLNTAKERKTYFSEIKVTNLMLYPDFEQEFELFEQLRGMQVRLEVEGAESPQVAAMFLGGLALPVKGPESDAPEATA